MVTEMSEADYRRGFRIAARKCADTAEAHRALAEKLNGLLKEMRFLDVASYTSPEDFEETRPMLLVGRRRDDERTVSAEWIEEIIVRQWAAAGAWDAEAASHIDRYQAMKGDEA